MLDFTWDINSFAQVNHRLYAIPNPLIYQQNTRHFDRSALHWAVIHGNEHTARKFLDEVAPEGIDNINEEYWDILSSAASHGYDAIVRALLEKGASPASYKGSDSAQPLERAVRSGHDAVFRMLVAYGANIDTLKHRDGIWIPVWSPGALSLLNVLVEDLGCDSAKFLTGTLLEAASRGKVDIVAYLLQLGCDVNVRAYDDDGGEELPICSAAQSYYVDTARFLIEHGADVNPVMRDGTTMYPLHLALGYHRRDIVSLLLEYTDLTTLPTDTNEKDLLLCAAAACGLEELAERLLEHGCNPDAGALEYDSVGEVDLIRGEFIPNYGTPRRASVWASLFGHMKVLGLLVGYGADRQWPLLEAIGSGWTRSVKLLLAKGANPTGMLSKCSLSAAIYRLLLDHGVDMALDDTKHSLRTAIRYRQVAAVRMLLDMGAKLDSIRNVLELGVEGAWLWLNSFSSVVSLYFHQTALRVKRLRNMQSIYKTSLSLSFYSTADAAFLEMTISPVFLEPCPRKITSLLKYSRPSIEYNGHNESVFKLLLEKGADPLHRDESGMSPLLRTTRSKFAGGIKMILEELASCEHISPKELRSEIRLALSEMKNRKGCGEVGKILQRFYYGELAGME